MAKNGNGNKLRTWICIIIGMLTLASIFAGGVLAWGDLGNKMDTHEVLQTKSLAGIVADADDLKVDGCDPARKHTTEIAVLKEKFDSYHKAQTTANTEILRLLVVK